jgi:hypothetical protein
MSKSQGVPFSLALYFGLNNLMYIIYELTKNKVSTSNYAILIILVDKEVSLE